MNDISLCTTFKEQRFFQEKVFDSWIKLPFKEIIIVDWGSRTSIDDMVEKAGDKRVKLLKVKDKRYFEMAKARNTAINYVKTKYFLLVDCDILLHQNFIHKHRITRNVVYTGYTEIDYLWGSVLSSKKIFERVGGYDERFWTGWWGDGEFIQRILYMMGNKIKIKPFSEDNVSHCDISRSLSKTSNLISDIESVKEHNRLLRYMIDKYPEEKWTSESEKEINDIEIFHV